MVTSIINKQEYSWAQLAPRRRKQNHSKCDGKARRRAETGRSEPGADPMAENVETERETLNDVTEAATPHYANATHGPCHKHPQQCGLTLKKQFGKKLQNRN